MRVSVCPTGIPIILSFTMSVHDITTVDWYVLAVLSNDASVGNTGHSTAVCDIKMKELSDTWNVWVYFKDT